ncbi:TIGR02328 family protein [Streptococcus cameli]
MRLWHEEMISQLPRQQLLGQHRECCALRGNGWGKKHATVNYVFDYSPTKLFQYHALIMEEMTSRGYQVSPEWLTPDYRGKTCLAYEQVEQLPVTQPIYPEHNAAYFKECLDNLAEKGIVIAKKD